jgi:hypothetical protein
MATIVIKDLAESIDLDREAMTAITGGARTGGRRIVPAQTISQTNRIVNFPSGFTPSRFATNKGKPSK